MDEFEKIRAFSEELGHKAEESLARENVVNNENGLNPINTSNQSVDNNVEFLREWNTSAAESGIEHKTLSKTFWLILSLSGIVLVGLLCVVYCLLRTSVENQEIVTIPPTPTPVKVKPENPGGMVIPDQDKVIYSRLSQDTLPVKVEKLFPEEQPVLPPTENIEAIEKVVPDVPAQPIEEVIVVTEQEKPEPKVKPVAPVVVPSVPVAKEKKKSEVWHVQLFSSSNKSTVETTWKKILSAHKGLLSDMPMHIEMAEISGKGRFYRLQVGDFSSKNRANNLCIKLKKQKQDCLAVSGK